MIWHISWFGITSFGSLLITKRFFCETDFRCCKLCFQKEHQFILICCELFFGSSSHKPLVQSSHTAYVQYAQQSDIYKHQLWSIYHYVQHPHHLELHTRLALLLFRSKLILVFFHRIGISLPPKISTSFWPIMLYNYVMGETRKL